MRSKVRTVADKRRRTAGITAGVTASWPFPAISASILRQSTIYGPPMDNAFCIRSIASVERPSSVHRGPVRRTIDESCPCYVQCMGKESRASPDPLIVGDPFLYPPEGWRGRSTPVAGPKWAASVPETASHPPAGPAQLQLVAVRSVSATRSRPWARMAWPTETMDTCKPDCRDNPPLCDSCPVCDYASRLRPPEFAQQR